MTFAEFIAALDAREMFDGAEQNALRIYSQLVSAILDRRLPALQSEAEFQVWVAQEIPADFSASAAAIWRIYTMTVDRLETEHREREQHALIKAALFDLFALIRAAPRPNVAGDAPSAMGRLEAIARLAEIAGSLVSVPTNAAVAEQVLRGAVGSLGPVANNFLIPQLAALGAARARNPSLPDEPPTVH